MRDPTPRPAARTACWAAPALRLGATRLVPVLCARARVSAGLDRACGGWADLRVVGVWATREGEEPRFLPAQAHPPAASGDWNAWLLSEPALLDDVAERLRASA